MTTFKTDGSPVATPVWITGAGGVYAFTTGDKAWKAIRLRRNPSVTVQACDMRGRAKADAVLYVGTGESFSSPDVIAAVERALAEKYGWQFRATKIVDRLKARFGRGPQQEVVAIHLVISDT